MTIAEKAFTRNPRSSFLKSAGLSAALGLALLVPGLSGLHAKMEEPATYQPVSPTIDQARANILIARQLQFTHFRDLGISDELSGDVFDAYLNYLDSQRVYLTQQDIDALSKVKGRLGSALKTGQLQPGFDIYNLVQQRIIERLKFAKEIIGAGVSELDFSANEKIRVDRSEAPWEADKSALDKHGIKRIRNAVLAQRLKGADDDDSEETLLLREE